VATIPLVCAPAGEGPWLAYALATVAILLVAFCVSQFARHSASPGSLYSYASMTLPPWLGATAAWSLLLAYVATGASVIGGFYHYGNLLLRGTSVHPFSAVRASPDTGGILSQLAGHRNWRVCVDRRKRYRLPGRVRASARRLQSLEAMSHRRI